jgi:hypothetical protein
VWCRRAGSSGPAPARVEGHRGPARRPGGRSSGEPVNRAWVRAMQGGGHDGGTRLARRMLGHASLGLERHTR